MEVLKIELNEMEEKQKTNQRKDNIEEIKQVRQEINARDIQEIN